MCWDQGRTQFISIQLEMLTTPPLPLSQSLVFLTAQATRLTSGQLMRLVILRLVMRVGVLVLLRRMVLLQVGMMVLVLQILLNTLVFLQLVMLQIGVIYLPQVRLLQAVAMLQEQYLLVIAQM